MNIKVAVTLTFVCLMLSTTSPVIRVRGEVWTDGPATSNLQIKIYWDPTTESWALDSGSIDINDCPLSKDFIDRWSQPASGVTLQSYAGIDTFQFDLNNAKWPTGINGGPFFNASDPWHVKAWMFRRALAHLTSKTKYITDYLKGYGYQIETMVPVPAMAEYTNYGTGVGGLTNATAVAETTAMYGYTGGYIYSYNKTVAIALLDAAGFTLNPVTNIRIDPKGDWSQNGLPEGDLKPLIFYIRIDDPNRRQAGEDLADEMESVGIPVNKIITERSACFQKVMVEHNYHIYTGNWGDDFGGLDPDLDFIYDLYHSSMSGYSYDTNYVWFRNHEFDLWAEKVKYAPAPADALGACLEAQWVAEKYVPVIDLWASNGVKGYRTGWDNVVNREGYGVDNVWSFQNMSWVDGPGTSRSGPTDTIVYGFRSDISALHVISSGWLWDWKTLNLIYSSLLNKNPGNLSEDLGWLANDWSTETVAGKTVISFTLRTDLMFHDDSTVTPEDVRFTIRYTKAAGLGVAFNYPVVMDVDHVDTQAQDAALGPNDVKVYFSVDSVWAIHWVGFLPIMNKAIWMAANTKYGFGYDDVAGTMSNPSNVRNYHPWTDDGNNNGIIDLKEDGAGPWKFVSNLVGETITLAAFPQAIPPPVPEFPLSLTLPLFMVLAMLVVVFTKKRKFKTQF